MSLTQANGALNLLGQAATEMPLVAPRLPAGSEGPRLDVAWGDFHQGVGSSVRALVTRGGVKGFASAGFLRIAGLSRGGRGGRLWRRCCGTWRFWRCRFRGGR